MTHGCGTLSSSSAGCSGFSASSSAIIAASASRRTSRSRRRNVEEQDISWIDCFVCSAKGIGNLLAILFCTRKLTRETRIMVAWFWVIAISVSCCLIVGVGLYGAAEFAAAPSDMRIIDNGYSTFICDSFKVKPSHRANIYLMPEIPPIDKKRRQTYNLTASMTVSGGTYEYWGFYLLADSSATVWSCTTGNAAMLYVIRGYRNLQEWISDNSCTTCFIYKLRIPKNAFCSSPSTYLKYRLHNLKNSDDIYFVYAVVYSSTANIRAKFELDKTLYNVSSAIMVQKESYDGFFELTYDSSEVVIYQIVPGSTLDLTVSIKTNCYPRVILYVAYFFFPPFIIGLLATCFILKKCKNPEQSSTINQGRRILLLNESPRTPLLSFRHTNQNAIQQQPGATTGATFPANPVLDDLPPKYETVEYTKNAPPSYEESLNASRP